MFTFEHKSADLHHSVTEIIKYVERLLPFACLVFSITLCETLFKFQASCFDELRFFSRVLCLVKCDDCLQVGEGSKISEVQVRVCYNWQRLFNFT